MKERPILFSAPMVRAILDGTKTQTRRFAKIPCKRITAKYGDVDVQEVKYYAPPSGKSQEGWAAPGINYWTYDKADGHMIGNHIDPCPYGEVGDQLWVRETHAFVPRTAYPQSKAVDQILLNDDKHNGVIFRAGWDGSQRGIIWSPSIYMPRWASRIQLEITGIRVERLQDISDQDALCEGVDRTNTSISGYAIERYKNLWETINGEDSWNSNPWVWVIEFKRVNP